MQDFSIRFLKCRSFLDAFLAPYQVSIILIITGTHCTW